MTSERVFLVLPCRWRAGRPMTTAHVLARENALHEAYTKCGLVLDLDAWRAVADAGDWPLCPYCTKRAEASAR